MKILNALFLSLGFIFTIKCANVPPKTQGAASTTRPKEGSPDQAGGLEVGMNKGADAQKDQGGANPCPECKPGQPCPTCQPGK